MIVVVNGTDADVEPGTCVEAALRCWGRDPQRRGFAVAVNGAVVPRGGWATTVLEESDRVEVLDAVQGG